MSAVESNTEATLAERCIVACAEAWRGDGEIIASGMGLIPRIGASLAMHTFSPDLMMTDSECRLVSEPIPVGPRGDYKPKIEGWLPFRKMFDLLWSGRRHAMTSPTQLDRLGYSNISFIGDPAKPKVALLGSRGIPGNSINHTNSFFIPNHNTRVFVEKVDMASGVGHDPARWRPGVRDDLMELRSVISNLGILDFGGPQRSIRLVALHPGVTVDTVRENTGFELAVADQVTETRAPSSEELRLIREVIDPHDLRATAVKAP